jgi:3-phosphoshikimate 1-carboxyvinyltransferase
MGRITDPLSSMGARFEALGDPGRLPIRVVGGALRPLEYRMPVASAQLKSALLLAGLVGGVPVSLQEPSRSRDHTESMLRGAGVPVRSGPGQEGWEVSLPIQGTALHPLDLDVPGDISSAAFFMLLGLLRGGDEPLVLEGVGLNQTRTGILTVLDRMGAEIRLVNQRGKDSGEPMGDLVVLPSELTGTTVGGSEIPLLIDEIPVLVVGALRARGETRITGAGELRVKETDRIRALVDNLRALGVEVDELDDGLAVEGTDRPLSGSVESFGDHRIAMAFGILGALPGNSIQIQGAQVAGVSYPGFWEMLEKLR